MNKEQLEALGLDAEQIKEVFKLNGIAVNNAKGDLDTKETELANTKKLLEEANTKIESFKDLNVDEIKKQAEDYKKNYKELEVKAKEDMEALKFEHELESAIRDSKAKNVTAVKALLDIESLKSSTDRKQDIQKALEATKADNDYLFQDEAPSGTGGSMGAGTKGKITITKDKIMEIGDPIERKRKIAENLELFN